MQKKVSKISFLQINLQHARAATATLCRQLDMEQDTIALIQEPWIVKSKISGLSKLKGRVFSNPSSERPRAALYIPRQYQAHLLPHLSSGDVVAVRLMGWKKEQKDIILASAYLPQDGPTPTMELERLVRHCGKEGWDLVIGCDANAHHNSWGSEGNNNRGKQLHDFIVSNNLYIANRGREPTFVNSRSQTIVDVTLASTKIYDKIREWRVSSAVTMSDHRWIKFTLE